MPAAGGVAGHPRRGGRLARGRRPAPCSWRCPASAPTATGSCGQAAEAGAAALLVSREPAAGEPPFDELGDVTIVRVADALAGLQAVAAAWRLRFDPLVVGITGSIAKTSTKEAVAGVLDEAFTTLRSEGNRNNEVGLPLTVLGLGPEHGAAVLEMGMYAGGEIRDLAAIARPSIGVVTAVQPVHLSRLGSIEAIEDAKAELVEALPGGGRRRGRRPQRRRRARRPDGLAHARARDDVRLRRWRRRARGRGRVDRVRGHALPPPHAGRGRAGRHPGPGPARRPQRAGRDGRGAGRRAWTLEAIVPGLAAPSRAEHRSVVVRAGGVTIVDDAYNASPGSMRAALELLAGLPGRHLAILGEMRELGAAHAEGHLEVGEAAAALDLLVVVDGGEGGAAEGIVARRPRGRRRSGRARRRSPTAAVALVAGEVRPGDVVLVKASRGVELERVVEGLVEALGGADER